MSKETFTKTQVLRALNDSYREAERRHQAGVISKIRADQHRIGVVEVALNLGIGEEFCDYNPPWTADEDEDDIEWQGGIQ